MSRLTRDGTAEPVSRDKILRRKPGQGNMYFPYSADHEQDWQPCPVDLYSTICDDQTYSVRTYIHLYTAVDTFCIACVHWTSSGCGKREAHKKWYMEIPEKATPVTGTILRTTGPVPADSRQGTPSVRDCATR